MPYIGNDIQYGELNSQTFTGDGSTTAFTLTYTVSNVNSLLVTVADVIQEPTTAYTVSGTTLTFTSAPANSDTIHVRYLGRTLDVGTTAIVQDSDQDTKIQVEESADEDTIRFDTGGTEIATATTTSFNINNLVNTAASGIIESSNANFVDTCLVGPSVDGKAWAGKFENGSVWSSLMLATVETSGANAEVNIWDLTAGVLASASPLATVTLTGATPTSIAASMGYVIVGTSDQGIHIVDPHGGSWAERTYGWPRSLSTTTSPDLVTNNINDVAAGVVDASPHDPSTGGMLPSFGVAYAATESCAIIKADGNVWDKSGVFADTIAFSRDRFHFNRSDDYVLSSQNVNTITADDWQSEIIQGTTAGAQGYGLGADTALHGSGDLLASSDAGGLTISILNEVSEAGSTSIKPLNALVTNSYNAGFLPVATKLAALANSKTADRSGNSNTLTENGTVTEAAVETGAELNGYGPFSTANFLDRTDSDFNTGTSAFTVMLWAKETSNDTSTRMFATWGAYSGSFTGNGQWSVYFYGGSTSGNRAVGMNCTDDNYVTQDALNTTVDAPESVWNHYAFVYDFPNSKMKIYLNGKKIGEGSTSNCTTVANASGSLIIGKRHDNASPFDLGSQSLFRHAVTAMNDDQVAKIYEAEKGMFVANAKCLLQGASNAVLDARVDPLTGKYIVTQSDTQDIFDGLAIETERTIASGGTTFEHGLLWGDGVAEINDANLYASMPATDQRQVNEMVRSMSAELPAGVDLSKAKAWVYFNTGTPIINATYNVESVTSGGTGLGTITWAVPFKTAKYVVVTGANDGTQALDVSAYITAQSTTAITVVRTEDSNDVNGDIYVACFGELENE